MGFLGGPMFGRTIEEARKVALEDSDTRSRLIKVSHRGNVSYAVREILPEFQEMFPVPRIIEIYLFEKYEGCYFYKMMDETAGPYYYDCPLSFFDLVPIEQYDASPTYKAEAEAWRAKVRAKKIPFNRKYPIGMRFDVGMETYTILSYDKGLVIAEAVSTGTLCKVSKKKLSAWVEPEPVE